MHYKSQTVVDDQSFVDAFAEYLANFYMSWSSKNNDDGILVEGFD